MKLTLYTAATLLLIATPVRAQWFGNPAEAGAQAYCAARSYGQNDDQARTAAATVMSGMVRPGFESLFTTVLTTGRAQARTAMYLAQQMCPQFFSSPDWQPDWQPTWDPSKMVNGGR